MPGCVPAQGLGSAVGEHSRKSSAKVTRRHASGCGGYGAELRGMQGADEESKWSEWACVDPSSLCEWWACETGLLISAVGDTQPHSGVAWQEFPPGVFKGSRTLFFFLNCNVSSSIKNTGKGACACQLQHAHPWTNCQRWRLLWFSALLLHAWTPWDKYSAFMTPSD